MTWSNMLNRGFRLATVLTMGHLFQTDMSCTGVGEKVVKNVNPCGTVLNCDPVEYDLLFAEYPDWDVDPTCTIPAQCGGPFPYRGAATTTP